MLNGYPPEYARLTPFSSFNQFRRRTLAHTKRCQPAAIAKMQSRLADLILSETPGKTPAAEADRRLALMGRAESAAQPQYGYWDCAAASPKIFF